MGVIKRGILGGFSGKVGSVVGSSWKGIAVIKSLPLSVANPRTAGQVSQRTKFSACVVAAQALLASIIKPNWDRFAQGMSGYNAFVSVNTEAFDSSGVLIPASFQAARGSLTSASFSTLLATAAGNQFECEFNDNSGDGSALATDEVEAVIFNQSTNEFGYGTSTSVRSDGTAIMESNIEINNGNVVHCYFFMRRADGSMVSNSSYLTITAS